MAIQKRVKYWELYLDGDLVSYLSDSMPSIEYGYMMSHFDEALSEPQGHKEADIQHWHTCPVFEEEEQPAP